MQLKVRNPHSGTKAVFHWMPHQAFPIGGFKWYALAETRLLCKAGHYIVGLFTE
jgi:hypothetical protein